MKKSIIPILLITTLISCSKENIDPIATISYPNEIGNAWVFLYYNSQLGSYDTLTITVTKDTLLNNGKHVKSLRYDYPYGSDKNFIYISNDSVILFETDHYNSSLFAYIFPLEIGKAWTNFNSAMVWDSTTVTERITIELFPNEYYEGFELRRKAWQFEGGYDQRVWFIPGIGEVKWFDSHVPLSLGHIDRELIKINFKPIKI
jgi:hypothetical protein